MNNEKDDIKDSGDRAQKGAGQIILPNTRARLR